MANSLLFNADWKGNITFPEIQLKFRTLKPVDFYHIEYAELTNLEICRHLCLTKRVFDRLPYSVFIKRLYPVIYQELLAQRVYTVRDWLQVAYQLLNKNWGSSLDWLEKQPIDKINLMVDLVIESRQENKGIDMLDS